MASAKQTCGAWSATATLEDGSIIAVPITCRSWDCPRCAHNLKRRLLRRLRYAKPNLFATLTTNERTAPTPDEAFARANAAIAVLIKRWRRRWPGERLEYFLVWERTKRGWPHAHILLLGRPVSKHWLSRTWRELSGAYIIDLQKVGSITHAATYLAKYLAKDPQVPPGFRRWRRSAGFFNVAAEPPAVRLAVVGKWERSSLPLAALAYGYVHAGLFVTQDPLGRIRASPDTARRQTLMASTWWTHTVEYVRTFHPGLLRPSDDYAV